MRWILAAFFLVLIVLWSGGGSGGGALAFFLLVGALPAAFIAMVAILLCRRVREGSTDGQGDDKRIR